MEKQGIEMNFVSSWEGWDEMGCSVLYFYKVQLKPDVLPFPIKEDVEYDLLVDCEKSIVEAYAVDETEYPVFTSKFKAVLI